MRNEKTTKKAVFPRFLICSLIGMLVAAATALLCALFAVKNDTDYNKYFLFAALSVFAGGFISAFLLSKRYPRKRFFAAVGQGALTGALCLLLIAALNSFSLNSISLVIPGAGIIGGILSGLITANIK